MDAGGGGAGCEGSRRDYESQRAAGRGRSGAGLCAGRHAGEPGPEPEPEQEPERARPGGRARAASHGVPPAVLEGDRGAPSPPGSAAAAAESAEAARRGRRGRRRHGQRGERGRAAAGAAGAQRAPQAAHARARGAGGALRRRAGEPHCLPAAGRGRGGREGKGKEGKGRGEAGRGAGGGCRSPPGLWRALLGLRGFGLWFGFPWVKAAPGEHKGRPAPSSTALHRGAPGLNSLLA